MNPSSIITAKISALVANATARGTSFVGVTYISKESGEVSRMVLLLGADYKTLVEKSSKQLEEKEVRTSLEIQAKQELIASFKNTLQNMALGKENDRYTKKGMYIHICKGIKVLENDESFEVCGLVMSKKVLVKGEHKVVNSKPLTVIKNTLKKDLPISKYRTLSLDVGHLDSIRVGGSEVEVE
jgi:hypothetical protein